MQIKELSFLLERRLGLSKWFCMEVYNINNDRGVISIPQLKPRALITPWSLLIHLILIMTTVVLLSIRHTRGPQASGGTNNTLVMLGPGLILYTVHAHIRTVSVLWGPIVVIS